MNLFISKKSPKCTLECFPPKDDWQTSFPASRHRKRWLASLSSSSLSWRISHFYDAYQTICWYHFGFGFDFEQLASLRFVLRLLLFSGEKSGKSMLACMCTCMCAHDVIDTVWPLKCVSAVVRLTVTAAQPASSAGRSRVIKHWTNYASFLPLRVCLMLVCPVPPVDMWFVPPSQSTSTAVTNVVNCNKNY